MAKRSILRRTLTAIAITAAVGLFLVGAFAGLLFLYGSLVKDVNPSVPAVDVSSATFATLDEKKAALEEHVRFRRNYLALDFELHVGPQGGGLPSPDGAAFDLRLRAVVPPAELVRWTQSLTPGPSRLGSDWLPDVGVERRDAPRFQWFTDSPEGSLDTDGNARSVGLDRRNNVVVYYGCNRC